MNECSSCPERDRLATMIDGTLAADAVGELEDHLAQCDDCQAVFHDLLVERQEVVSSDDTNNRSNVVDSTLAGPSARHVPITPPEIPGVEISEVVGQGGMGVVFRARQTRHGREVAIKLIRTEWVSEEFLGRFDREIAILASMEHSQIARLYDVGQTEDHKLYIVMEYIEGVPLDQYCQTHRMTIEQRLEMFASICDTVQDLHNSQIVHRDLKPGNILVRQGDDGPQPVLIDFGLAKFVADAQETDHELTREYAPMGSIRYMSPEQAKGRSVWVNALTDEYSLGAILYLLLTGDTPLGADSCKGAAWHELLRVIQENEAVTPSDRLKVTDEITQSHLASMSLDRESLRGRLKGDLDAIVLRSLRLEADERYASVAEFAGDIRRLLNDEVVVAREPTRRERFAKFYRRNRALTWTACAFALLCLLAIGGTSFGLIESLAAEKEVSDAFDRESKERIKADQRLENFLTASETLQGVFDDINPELAQAGNGSLRTALIGKLRSAAENINTSEIEDTEEVIKLKGSLANAILALGDAQSAVPLFERILRDIDSQYGSRSREWVDGQLQLYRVAMAAGQPQRAQDILLAAKAVASEVYPDNHIVRLAIGHYIAHTQAFGGHFDVALSTRIELKERLIASGQEDHPIWLDSLNSLGVIQTRLGQYEDAVESFEEVLEDYRAAFSEDHPMVFTVRSNLAMARSQAGDTSRAIAELKDILDQSKIRYPIGSTVIVRQQNNLANELAKVGRQDEAQALLQDALETSTDPLMSVKTQINFFALKVLYLDQAEEGMRELVVLQHEILAEHGEDHELAFMVRQIIQNLSGETD